ncbi:MAG: hypothetical protein LBC29_06925 [Propionibacteriaceae bacterium]|jgi:hypothetical protein|nr:hypothetical protein [Propionibacteriaceae bacterium]
MNILNLPAKKRPIPSARALDKWISDAQKQTGVAAQRLGWILASTVVVAALQRAATVEQMPMFLVKGGVYIELQLGLKARTVLAKNKIRLAGGGASPNGASPNRPPAGQKLKPNCYFSAVAKNCAVELATVFKTSTLSE